MPRFTRSEPARTGEQQAARQPNRRAKGPSSSADSLVGLQRAAGNRAVDGLVNGASDADLLRRASAEPGAPVSASVRQVLANVEGASFDAVRVHTGPASAAAAERLGARALTLGTDIYLGHAATQAPASERQRIETHEAVHTLQHGGGRVPLEGTIPIADPASHDERLALRLAGQPSDALAVRNELRRSHLGPLIYRDITGSKELRNGKMEIKFKKLDATVAGNPASEDGTISFMPNTHAAESKSIKLLQVVRTIDIGGTTAAAGADVNWAKIDKGGEAPRNQMLTKGDVPKNIAPGFYVDQQAALLAKRTKKADPAVSAFYQDTPPFPAANKIGKKDGKTREPTVLGDTPGTPLAIDFRFVTSAKAADRNFSYGTVLWGFKTNVDPKTGITKIKDEYHSFREFEGETMQEALREFNEFYRNPGSTTAPTK